MTSLFTDWECGIGCSGLRTGPIAADSQGNLYYYRTWGTPSGFYSQIERRGSDGTVSTYAGISVPAPGMPFAGENVPALQSTIGNVTALALDATGNLFIADGTYSRVRKMTAAGVSSTVASRFSPAAMAIDSFGNLMVADARCQIRRVPPAGAITVIAGTGGRAAGSENGPVRLAADGMGNLLVAEGTSRVQRISAAGVITTVAGLGAGMSTIPSGDGGPATSANLPRPYDVGPDTNGNVVISTTLATYGVRRVNGAGIISSIAIPNSPMALANDAAGNTYVVNFAEIWKITPSAAVTAVPKADAVPLVSLAVDGAGILYGSSDVTRTVRRIAEDGTAADLAGCNGSGCLDADGVAATSAILDGPAAVAGDATSGVYVAERNRHRRRKISGGIIRTVAGNGTAGPGGDGGPATEAQLALPESVAVDAAGNLYIADTYGNRIRKVTPAGVITTLAGTGEDGHSGDGGPATAARIARPGNLKGSASGEVFFVEGASERVRKIPPAGGGG